MKHATVRYIYQDQNTEGYIIESELDLDKLMDYTKRSGEKVAERMVKTDLPVSKFDHLSGGTGLQDGITNLSVIRSKLTGRNPLYGIDDAVSDYLRTATKLLHEGYKVFVNEVGGMTPVDEKILEIISEVDVEEIEVNKPKPLLRKYGQPKSINLENDPELERVAVDYMKDILKDRGRWGDYFWAVTELRDYSHSDLVDIFDKFQEKGGYIVYVYTTGMDVQQMYDYSSAAIESGLDYFIFDFNQGINEDIQEFINWLKEKVTTVELVDSKKELKESGNPYYKEK